MNPAFSVIFLTTLIGAGQGLFLALYAAQLAGAGEPGLFAAGAAISLGLCALGLLASFFHLGHPERAWRAAAMWRSSWLSREVIALPLFMAGLFTWGLAHALGWPGTAWLGALAALLCAALFVCTAMIYASIRFLQEWASPLTLLNYTLLGCASGTTLATALVASMLPQQAAHFAGAALLLTVAGLASRAASLRRNARLKPRSTLQTAIGIKHPGIVQRAQGFMGGSFNTREFFHGRTTQFLRSVRWFFLGAAFVLPAVLLASSSGSAMVLAGTFGLQFLGLLAERWFFFAQANHPQNLYYQAIS
jgi:DMSO reductase anchor subunit